jgi:hypothetical protein
MPLAAASQAERPRLADEVGAWRAALARGRTLPATERLVVFDEAGQALSTADGDRSHVTLPAPLELALQRHDSRLTLVHNHPNDSGLSSADLAQLRKPGIARIVAVAHEGSVFEAAAGPRFDDDVLRGAYATLLARIAGKLDSQRDWPPRQMAEAYELATHLAALALDRSGVIVYRAALSPRRRGIVDRFDWLFAEIVRMEGMHLDKVIAAPPARR